MRFLMTHPLGKLRRAEVLRRFLQWQFASRLSPGPIVLPFIAGSRLLVASGMAAATGNLYVGLHEFADMAFLLHALRPQDVFFDVGANIGAYTVLAAKVVGAYCVAIEPIEATALHLRDNVMLNEIGDRVRIERCAVGETQGVVRMTSNHDSTNRVVADGDASLDVVGIRCVTLDEILGSGPAPQLMKMDIEGYELPALRGATRLLSSPALRACIVEIWSRSDVHSRRDHPALSLMRNLGFKTAAYDGFSRVLQATEGLSAKGNTLFVRDWEWVEARVRTAPPFVALGQTL
jgi:FkbM family methyltransferase